MLFSHLRESFRDPAFWAYATWLGIVTSYRRSRLGVLWLFTPPIIFIWGLGSFFAGMFGVPLSGFAAHVAIGYVVFRLVTACVTESTSVMTANQAFILDGHVRLTDFVLRVMARAFFHFLIALPVVAVALWVHPQVEPIGLLYALVTVPLILLNALCVGVVLSLIGARFPDVEQLTASIFMFMFLLTPIIWFARDVPEQTTRGMLARFNPLYHMVELVRAPILGESLEPLSVYYLAALTTLGMAVAAWAYRRYARFVPLWV